MIRRKWKIFCFYTSIVMLGAVFCGVFIANILPEQFEVIDGERLRLASLPVTIRRQGAIKADVPASVGDSYTANLRLLGLLEVKNVQVHVVKTERVVPDGETFGIKLYTDGVMIVGIGEVETSSGKKSPASDAGVQKGDQLIAVDGKTVNTNQEVGESIAGSKNKGCTLSLRRNGVAFTVRLHPQQDTADGTYKGGFWVRDSTAGIGTVTYYNPQTGYYGGLGHAVCDVDTGKKLPLLNGEAVNSTITSVEKGENGRAGELVGNLENNRLGTLLLNTDNGVYGVFAKARAGKSVPIAMKQQVQSGKATVLSTLDETGPHAYEIQIEKINYAGGGHDMVVRVTDPKLIARTGGIVQGMSGSPILQNGMLVGALTHVFINNPQKGYAIFAENMMHTASSLELQH